MSVTDPLVPRLSGCTPAKGVLLAGRDPERDERLSRRRIRRGVRRTPRRRSPLDRATRRPSRSASAIAVVAPDPGGVEAIPFLQGFCWCRRSLPRALVRDPVAAHIAQAPVEGGGRQAVRASPAARSTCRRRASVVTAPGFRAGADTRIWKTGGGHDGGGFVSSAGATLRPTQEGRLVDPARQRPAPGACGVRRGSDFLARSALGIRSVRLADGVIEAHNPRGEVFGPDRVRRLRHPPHSDGPAAPETLRRLIRAIRECHHRRLRDDATILLLIWHCAGT
ncbi:SpoIIE family protein phosphatase [Embleya sp. NPDC001921]